MKLKLETEFFGNYDPDGNCGPVKRVLVEHHDPDKDEAFESFIDYLRASGYHVEPSYKECPYCGADQDQASVSAAFDETYQAGHEVGIADAIEKLEANVKIYPGLKRAISLLGGLNNGPKRS